MKPGVTDQLCPDSDVLGHISTTTPGLTGEVVWLQWHKESGKEPGDHKCLPLEVGARIAALNRK